MKVTTRFIALGTKRNCSAFVLGALPKDFVLGKPVNMDWPSYKATGQSSVSICNSHASGKACGLLAYDAGCYVSARGESFSVYPLSQALSKGLVKRHVVKVNRDGKVVSLTVYAPKTWSPAMKQARVMAAECPAGRIESATCSDGRNSKLVCRIVSDKATK